MTKQFRFDLGDVRIEGTLSPNGDGSLAEVILFVHDPLRPMDVEYHFQNEIEPGDGTPYDMWQEDRYMYSLALDGVPTWRALLAPDVEVERHLLPIRVHGASEEPGD